MLTIAGLIVGAVVLLVVIGNMVTGSKRQKEMETAIIKYTEELASINKAQEELDKRRQLAEKLLFTSVKGGD